MRILARGGHVLAVGVAALSLTSCGGGTTNPPLNDSMSQSVASKKTPNFQDVYVFCQEYPSCSDGGQPSGSVVLDATGAIYGPLNIGGAGNYCGHSYGCGAIYKLTSSGSRYTESVLYSFCTLTSCRDGSSPAGALLFDVHGDLYGTATAGGHKNGGLVFELTPSGSGYSENVLYKFCQAAKCADGEAPSAGVISDGSGALYGTTTSGGHKNAGVVFKLTPSRSGYTENVLYSFCRASACTDGQTPSGGVIFGPNGALYGTTAKGGAHGAGTAFQLSPSGSAYTESVLYSFCAKSHCTDGANPEGDLIFGRDGTLFGTTLTGGATNCYAHGSGCGTVFKLTPSGTTYKERVLHWFCHEVYACVDGAFPTGVAMDTNGVLFGGTTYGGRYDQQGSGGGLIFKLVPSKSGYKYRVLYYFGPANSFRPNTTPALNDDTLFGTSQGIIPIKGPVYGTVWELQHVRY